MQADDYLLGHDPAEWDRLEAQHTLWRSTILGAVTAAGIGPGARVLEVGCGSGALSTELADVCGPDGRLIGLELDPHAAARTAARLADRPWVTVRVGDVTVDPLGGPYDAIVSRWVFSFLPDPAAVIARLAGALAPGGHLIIEDYVHDGVRMLPVAPAFDRVIEAVRAAYRAQGGDLRVAGRLPGAMIAAGLEVVGITPNVKAGGPGSGPWTWVGDFLHAHTPALVEAGHLTTEEHARFIDEWARLERAPGTVLFTPQIVDVVGRKVSR